MAEAAHVEAFDISCLGNVLTKYIQENNLKLYKESEVEALKIKIVELTENIEKIDRRRITAIEEQEKLIEDKSKLCAFIGDIAVYSRFDGTESFPFHSGMFSEYSLNKLSEHVRDKFITFDSIVIDRDASPINSMETKKEYIDIIHPKVDDTVDLLIEEADKLLGAQMNFTKFVQDIASIFGYSNKSEFPILWEKENLDKLFCFIENKKLTLLNQINQSQKVLANIFMTDEENKKSIEPKNSNDSTKLEVSKSAILPSSYDHEDNSTTHTSETCEGVLNTVEDIKHHHHTSINEISHIPSYDAINQGFSGSSKQLEFQKFPQKNENDHCRRSIIVIADEDENEMETDLHLNGTAKQKRKHTRIPVGHKMATRSSTNKFSKIGHE